MTNSPLLLQFQQHFRQRLEAAAQKRVSHKNIPRHYRRLDSLARLLEGNSICAAVYYDTVSKSLWLTNNKVHDGSRETNAWIAYLQKVFILISDEKLEIKEIIAQMIDVLYINISQEHWQDSKNLQELDLKKWLEELLNEMFKSGLETAEWKLSKLREIIEENSNLKNTKERVIKRVYRLMRDFLKIRDFLLKNHTNSLATGILAAIRANNFEILHIDTKDVHAEMRILTKLSTQNSPSTYIGISKLCCNHCALAVQTFGVATRGIHGEPTKWPLPKFIADDQNNFAKYVGPKAFDLFNEMSSKEKNEARLFVSSKEGGKHNHIMMADTSDDSDIEFGPSCDDDEAEEIAELPWRSSKEIGEIRYHYPNEFKRLCEIGLPYRDIVELYMHSHNLEKFIDMADRDTINFILEVAENEDESSYDIFMRISDFYDTDRDSFFSLIQDENAGAKKYGFNEVTDKCAEEKANSKFAYDSDGDKINFYDLAIRALESDEEFSSTASDNESATGSEDNFWRSDNDTDQGYSSDDCPEPLALSFGNLSFSD